MTWEQLKITAQTTRQLVKDDITTMLDIDIYRVQQAKDSITKSRYQTMVDIYGRKQADIMMRNLEVRSW